MNINRNSLEFHKEFPAGKVGISITKDLHNKLDLAYSPGVAAPCLEIEKDKSSARLYTNIGNSIAIISNGTAVLGLGKIGALASKPVMEGKAALFKMLAGIDCIDIEIEERDPSKLIDSIAAIATTFGGINLEDICAPECFEVEAELKSRLSIPVFHDDQHGTAIVSCAAILNAMELVGKKMDQVRVVCLGAGAAGIACLHMMETIGILRENITLFDSKGSISEDRSDLNTYKRYFAQPKSIAIEDALDGADIFLGTSVADAFKPEWLTRMAQDPLLLALAYPVPEIHPDAAKAIRADAIVCTGRSDLPNQVNNILCFPYLFRVALDTGLAIDERMKLAATNAIAARAKVMSGYGKAQLMPNPTDISNRYVIPSFILGSLDGNADLNQYARSITRRFMPISHSIFELSAENRLYIPLADGSTDDIASAWGYKKADGITMENLSEDSGVFFLNHGHEYAIVAAKEDNWSADLARKIGARYRVDPNCLQYCRDEIIGAIHGNRFEYNSHKSVDQIALFSILCGVIQSEA